MSIYPAYAPKHVFFYRIIMIVDVQKNSLVLAQPLVYATNSVKCFSVFRAYLNIGCSVYMRHYEHYSEKKLLKE